MMNLTKLVPLALCGCLLLGGCKDKNEPSKPSTPKPVIEGTRLVAYPVELIPADGAITLDRVTEIAPSVFEGVKTLKSVKALALKKIGAKAFKDATSLMSLELTSTTLPETYASAFEGTPRTKALTVPATLVDLYLDWATAHGFATINGKPIGQLRILYDAQGLLQSFPDKFISAEGVVALPEAVKEIPKSFFFGKTTITAFVAPGVTTIGSQTFQGCSKLTKVSLPKLSGEIPAHAFAGCAKLAEVTVGNGVTGAVGDAFEGTPEDKKLYIDSPTDKAKHEAWAVARGFRMLNDVPIERDAPTPLPEGFTHSERTITGAPQLPHTMKELSIPKYYQVLASFCFKRNNSGGSYLLTLSGAGIKRVEESALEGMTNLQVIDFPLLEYIGNNGMAHPSSLKRVDFPLCTEIGKNAFEAGSQSALTEVLLPALQVWGEKAFYGHTKIQRVRLGTTPPKVASVNNKYRRPIGTDKSPKPTLEVPKGSKDAYEKWDARKFFGDIKEY